MCSTLVLVHRQPLLEQWRSQIGLFLGRDAESVGQVEGGGERKLTGQIDLAMIQSLSRKDSVVDMVAEYGQVMVDECHLLPVVSFERVLSELKARPDTTIQELYGLLVADYKRNEQIINDVLMAMEEGPSPILLTERKEHLEKLHERLKGFVRHIVILRGGRSAKERGEVQAQLASIPMDEERLFLATGRYTREGFDDARLDTLFLALPVSWKGTLVQAKQVLLYALHRHARRWLADPAAHPAWSHTMQTVRLSTKQLEALRHCVQSLPDCRHRRRVRHRYASVLTIALGAVLGGHAVTWPSPSGAKT